MKFLIVSHVVHKYHEGRYWAYGPYIREMNLWEKHITELLVVAPKITQVPSAIDLPFQSVKVKFIEVPAFNLVGAKNMLFSIQKLPITIWRIAKAMQEADHIHLRCPGNMGLLGAMIQVFFPTKKKTAKYAGNWDWNSKQPWSYRLQQRLLRNTFLTKNMQALVYGEWPDQTVNIKPFFTATYSEKEKISFKKPEISDGIHLIFVGSLVKGKRPELSLLVLEQLSKDGKNVHLVYCGDGSERASLEKFTISNNLSKQVEFLGNVDAERVKLELQKAHFLVFASRSEGWPKAVAEAMWWGCIPVTTPVSCVPQMLGDGSRGVLKEADPKQMTEKILELVSNLDVYNNMQHNAMVWSRQYTLERFEDEIKQLL